MLPSAKLNALAHLPNDFGGGASPRACLPLQDRLKLPTGARVRGEEDSMRAALILAIPLTLMLPLVGCAEPPNSVSSAEAP